jgi:hypothetical protein
MLSRICCSVIGFVKRHRRFFLISLLVVLVLAAAPIIYAKIYQNWDRDPDRGAIAIKDGAYGESYSTPRYLDQGWSRSNSLWFYNTTQGSGLMPYDFFLVLKKADSDELFRSDKNVDHFRYLPQKKTFFNPDALPLGFVKNTYKGKDYVGYTCAACHTGQVNFKGNALRIDGGPAMADMVGFLTAVQKAMEAAQSGDKQKSFVADVLKLKNDYGDAKAVTDDLERWKNILWLYNVFNHSEVDYGNARLDAFGRIYNRVVQHIINKEQFAKQLGAVVVLRGREQTRLLTPEQIEKVMEGVSDRLVLTEDDIALIVRHLFSKDPGFPGLGMKDFLYVRNSIFSSPDAPVSYPFLWDISHSDYLQWNGLASNASFGPLGRNTGEVIGVFGILDWGSDTSSKLGAWLRKFSLPAFASGQKDKKETISFNSSINLFNLQRLESQLGSLKSPEWPFCRNAKGEHYLPNGDKDPISPSDKDYCQGADTRFDEPRRKRGGLLYIARCEGCHTVVDRSAWDRLVVSTMIGVEQAGTDPAMADNSVRHNGRSGNFKDTYQSVAGVGDVIIEENAPVVQILTAATKGVVASPESDKWFIERWSEWVYALVASLGDNTIKASVKHGSYDPDTSSSPYASLRAYKARSLNGIWATAPYLHNGSVPTLWDLLLPAEQRPRSFRIGAREFDPEKVGFRSEGYEGFEFRTIQRGNLNTGHDKYCPEKGCPPLTDEQMWDLIEYLKSL